MPMFKVLRSSGQVSFPCNQVVMHERQKIHLHVLPNAETGSSKMAKHIEHTTFFERAPLPAATNKSSGKPMSAKGPNSV